MPLKKKSGIIVEHFYNNVRMKIKGKARTMVVTGSIKGQLNIILRLAKNLEKERVSTRQ